MDSTETTKKKTNMSLKTQFSLTEQTNDLRENIVIPFQIIVPVWKLETFIITTFLSKRCHFILNTLYESGLW